MRIVRKVEMMMGDCEIEIVKCVCVCLYVLAILCVKREGYRDRFVDDVVETECRE